MGTQANIQSHQDYLNTKYFSSLNGLRFLCIMAVLWHHSGAAEFMTPVFRRGFLGVDMFFVLSGFLIVTLLLRESASKGSISLKGFYIRRALRIFPVYYGVLLAITGAYLLAKPNDSSTSTLLTTLPYYLTFTSNWSITQAANFGIFWSLATEEQFYMLWPLVEKLFNRTYTLIFLFLILLFNQAINFGLLDSLFAKIYQTDSSPHLEILDATFTPICLGVLLAHSLHSKRAFIWIQKACNQPYSVYLAIIILIAAITLPKADISGAPRLLIQLAMTYFLATLLFQSSHIIKSILTNPFIARLGEISYGAYIFHLLVFGATSMVLNKLNMPLQPLGLFFIGSITTFIIAELSYRFYEKPFLSLKNKLT